MIHHIRLPICLWMIGTTEVQLRVNHLLETQLKMTKELSVSVRNYKRQQPMKMINFPEEQLSNMNNISSLFVRNKMYHLRESIYHHINRITPSLVRGNPSTKSMLTLVQGWV